MSNIILNITSSFIGLSDTPSSYATHGGKLVAVKSDETGLEFLESEVPDLVVQVTKQQLDNLISTSTLVEGAIYNITNVHPTLYDDGTTSGTSIFLQALTNNQLSKEGSGIFYNPKYDKTINGFGIWTDLMSGTTSNIVGNFGLNNKETVIGYDSGANIVSEGVIYANGLIKYSSGDWSLAETMQGQTSGATADISSFVNPTYAIGQKVIYGGYVWENVNGNIGTSIDVLNLDSAEWQKIPYDTVNYNRVLDTIEYDVLEDMIIRRYEVESSNDVVFNKISLDYFNDGRYNYNAISVFQFGNAFDFSLIKGMSNIKVTNSVCENINFRGSAQSYLTFDNNSYQTYLTFDNDSNQSYLTFDNNSYQNNLTFDNGSNQENLTFYNNSSQTNLTFDNGSKQTNLTFLGYVADFQNVVYSLKAFSNISFIGDEQIPYTIPDLNSATYIFDTYPKEVYQRPDGQLRLKFMNDTDVLEVVELTD